MTHCKASGTDPKSASNYCHLVGRWANNLWFIFTVKLWKGGFVLLLMSWDKMKRGKNCTEPLPLHVLAGGLPMNHCMCEGPVPMTTSQHRYHSERTETSHIWLKKEFKPDWMMETWVTFTHGETEESFHWHFNPLNQISNTMWIELI